MKASASFKELDELSEHIYDSYDEALKHGVEISFIMIDEINFKVIVYLKTLNASTTASFKKYVTDSDAVTLKPGDLRRID